MEIPIVAQAVAVIIGLVNGARLLKEEDKWGFVFFCLALVAGLLLGVMGWFGLTPESGLVAALVSSGVYRVAQIF